MRRPILILALGVAAVCVSAGAACASAAIAAPTPIAAPPPITADLTMALHESRRVILPGEAATIVVADPTVADVAVNDAHSLILLGRGYGVTQLLVSDRAGRILLQSQVSVVSSNAGRVTLYRGVAASEFACGGGRCQRLGGSGGGGGGDAAASAPDPSASGASAP
jgi:hypothetical protein